MTTTATLITARDLQRQIRDAEARIADLKSQHGPAAFAALTDTSKQRTVDKISDEICALERRREMMNAALPLAEEEDRKRARAKAETAFAAEKELAADVLKRVETAGLAVIDGWQAFVALVEAFHVVDSERGRLFSGMLHDNQRPVATFGLILPVPPDVRDMIVRGDVSPASRLRNELQTSIEMLERKRQTLTLPPEPTR